LEVPIFLRTLLCLVMWGILFYGEFHFRILLATAFNGITCKSLNQSNSLFWFLAKHVIDACLRSGSNWNFFQQFWEENVPKPGSKRLSHALKATIARCSIVWRLLHFFSRIKVYPKLASTLTRQVIIGRGIFKECHCYVPRTLIINQELRDSPWEDIGQSPACIWHALP